jgi:hypothetical protein
MATVAVRPSSGRTPKNPSTSHREIVNGTTLDSWNSMIEPPVRRKSRLGSQPPQKKTSWNIKQIWNQRCICLLCLLYTVFIYICDLSQRNCNESVLHNTVAEMGATMLKVHLQRTANQSKSKKTEHQSDKASPVEPVQCHKCNAVATQKGWQIALECQPRWACSSEGTVLSKDLEICWSNPRFLHLGPTIHHHTPSHFISKG